MLQKTKIILDTTEDNRTYRIAYKEREAPCSICRWHRGNCGNKTRWVRHGVKKPKYKDHRRNLVE